MAKLKAPLMSLGASGAIGKVAVYFGWKGLDVAREYVVPTNPKSDKQKIQRGYLQDVVAAIHAAEQLAVRPLALLDKIAESLLGSTYPTPRTWFNVICKRWLDQNVATLKGCVYRGATLIPSDGQVYIDISWTPQGLNDITAGKFWYGTSKTSMPYSIAGEFLAPTTAEKTITGLTNGQKYFFQFRPTAHADFVGCNSGIYSDIPKA